MFYLFVILSAVVIGTPGEAELFRQVVDKNGVVQSFPDKADCEAFAQTDEEFLAGMKVIRAHTVEVNKKLHIFQQQVKWECARLGDGPPKDDEEEKL